MFDVTPIPSMNRYDCGPTCLAMLLNYYSMPYDQKELIEECGCDITGCNGKDMLRVGRAHGMDMKSYKTDVDGVVKADRPTIIWWQYDHFVVCCGEDENGQVVICNPNTGRFRISRGSFASFYTGIAFSNGELGDLLEDEEAAV